MVVDRLLNCLAFFDRLHLLIHEIKVVRPWVEGGNTLLLSPGSVQGMVVIKAYHRRGVTDEGVGVRVATLGWLCSTTKHTGETAHEGTLPAS